MANANIPPGTERDLLYGVLAIHLDFVGRTDFEHALQAWAGESNRPPIGQILVERKALAPRRRSLLDDLTVEVLLQHDMDAGRALTAVCASREIPVDIAGLAAPALRGNLATLPAAPSTLPGHSDSGTGACPSIASDRRYRIVRPHGRGALGEVYVAHDQELNREVALKEIQTPYADNEESRARFVLEAEITGSLEHPGVVPVYSLGTYANGRPFYAMRFIKGESLHEAITRFHQADMAPDRDPSERALSLRGLLARFVAVCNAIGYAHARGVIHRDIKPSNIMLGAYGETLVVDWGLAKAFDQPITPDSIELPVHPLSSHSTQATMLGQAVGTPAFMPPEQAAGRVDQVGPPADIYSLGATLFTMLTGTPPFAGSVSEVLRLVTSHTFPLPRRANRSVPAALEAIVLKAMAFHPEDRYASVNDLAADVERWLADETVRAYREPPLERLGRYMRHHRPLVYGVAALLITMVFGLGVVLVVRGVEQARTREQRDLAEKNLDLAKDAVKKCFVTATEHPLMQQTRMRGVRKVLLEQALEFYEKSQFSKLNDDTIRQEHAETQFRVARITEEVGTKEKAIEYYRSARDEFENLARIHPHSDTIRANLGRILNNLGILQRDEDGRAALASARTIREELALANPDNSEYQSELADTYNNLGALQRASNPAEAAKNFTRAGEIFARLAKAKPDFDRYQAELAATFHNKGDLYAMIDNLEASQQAYEEAMRLRDALADKNPTVGDYRADAARTRLGLAALLEPTGDENLIASATEYRKEAVELLEALAKEDREVIEYQVDRARALSSLGKLLADRRGQFPDAVKMLRRAVKEMEAVKSSNPEYKIDLAGFRVNLGRTLTQLEPPPAEATKMFDLAIEELGEVAKKTPGLEELGPLLMKAHWGRAEARAKLREFAGAMKDFDAALHRSTPGEPEFTMIRKDKALALCHSGDHVRAVKEAMDLQRKADDKSARKGALAYELACVVALAAKVASEDKALTPQQREEAINQYIRDAIDLLTRAQDVKFFEDPKYLEIFRTDKDFEFIRGRRDKTFIEFEKQLQPQGKKE